MTTIYPPFDQSNSGRKATTIGLVRELATLLAALADLMDSSQINSGDWFAIQLQSAQAACAAWQRRAAAHVRAWDMADFDRQNELPPDL